MFKLYKPFYRFLLIFVLLFPAATLFKSHLFRINQQFTITLGSFDTLIIGDSHAKNAFDPKYISNSINAAQESENIIYSFYVLNKILATNHGIKKVIVAFSYHTLGAPFAYFEPNEMMRRYHLLLPKRFYFELSKNEGFYSPYATRFLIDIFHLPLGLINDFYEYILLKSRINSKIPYIGQYSKLSGSKIASKRLLRETILRHFKHNGKIVKVSNMKVIYIRKIIDLCISKNVKLFFVTTPVHPDYFNEIPKSVIKTSDDTMNSIKKNYSIKYINLSRLNLPLNHYYDYDHLNWMGAEVFSKLINKQIE